MSENKQGETPVKSKRRSLYYILLSACALIVAAAITLTVVFFPQPGESDLENTDPPVEQPDDNDDDEDKDDDEEPSSTEIVFSLPVSGATVATGYTFWYNSTLNRYNLHTGVDFKAEAGTSVTAAYAGTVESVTQTLLEGGKVAGAIPRGFGKGQHGGPDGVMAENVGFVVHVDVGPTTQDAALRTLGEGVREVKADDLLRVKGIEITCRGIHQRRCGGGEFCREFPALLPSVGGERREPGSPYHGRPPEAPDMVLNRAHEAFGVTDVHFV